MNTPTVTRPTDVADTSTTNTVPAATAVAAPTEEPGDRSRSHGSRSAAVRIVGPPWFDPRIALVAAAGLAAAWGTIAGWWTPRSPLTSSEAIWSIVISLVVGAAAGLVARSRWAMVSHRSRSRPCSSSSGSTRAARPSTGSPRAPTA